MVSPYGSLRLIWSCATALIVGWLIGATGMVDAIEQNVDVVIARFGRHDRAAERIALVRIGAEEYQDAKLFAGRRPLDPAVLRRLIETIAAQQPAVIGVDIDTSPAVFAALHDLHSRLPVVWARPAEIVGKVLDKLIEPGPVLGYSSVEAEGDEAIPAGIGLLPHDSDGIVRAYVRRFKTLNGERPSFACAILTRCAAGGSCADEVRTACQHADLGREWLIDYREASQVAWTNPGFSAGELLAHPPANALRDKIVLIGATFPESGDVDHPTPVGGLYGIGLLAQVLATELRGGGPNPGGTLATTILLVFETYLILLVLDEPTRRRRLAGAAVLVIGFALLASLVNEHNLRRTGHFAVVLLFVLLIQGGVWYVERSQTMLLEWWRERRSRAGPAS